MTLSPRLRRFLPASLRLRLLLLVTLASLPAAAVIYFQAETIRNEAVDDAKAEVLIVARFIQAANNEISASANQVLQILATLPVIQNTPNLSCARALNRVLEAGNTFSNFGIVALNGNIICSAIKLPGGVNISDRGYFRKALGATQAVKGDYQVNRVTKIPSINYAMSVRDEHGQVKNVVFATLAVSKLLDALPTASFSSSMRVTIVSPDLTVLSRTGKDGWQGKSLYGSSYQNLLSNGKPEGISIERGLEGQLRVIGYTTVRTSLGVLRGYTVVSVPMSTIEAPARRALWYGFTLLLMAMLTGTLVILVGSRFFILNRVDSLVEATNKLISGDRKYRIRYHEDQNELSLLERSFNTMATNIDAQFTQLTRLNRVYFVLTEINSALLRIHNAEELATEAARIAVEIGGYHTARIFLIDPNSPQLMLASLKGSLEAAQFNPKINVNDPVEPPDGPNHRAIKTGKPVILQDLERGPDYHNKQAILALGVRSIAALPLLSDGKVTGSIVLWSQEVNGFPQDEEKLLLRLAGDTSLGLEHIEKEKTILRLNRVYAMLSEINRTNTGSHTFEAMAEESCRIAVETGGYLMALILLHDECTGETRLAGHAGVAREFFESEMTDYFKAVHRLDTPIYKAVLQDTVAIEENLGNIVSPSRWARIITFGVKAVAAFPLRLGEEIKAGLLLWTAEKNVFNGTEVALLQQLAFDTALHLKNIRQSERVHQLTNYDSLTGLPSRTLFEDRIMQTLARAPHHNRVAGVLILRVDQLTKVTVSMGQAGAEAALKHVAQYLNTMVRPGDTVGKLGDNEFGVLLADMGNANDLIIICDRILSEYPKSMSWAEEDVPVNLRMGIATFPQDGNESAILIRNARLALRSVESKASIASAYYSRELDAKSHKHHAMEQQLAHAAERGELSLAYQPKVHIQDRRILGAEALLRWHNPTLGQISPAEFIPIAESSGLIVSIGDWVLATAMARRKAWQALLPGDFCLWVNISVQQLRQPDFVEKAGQLLNRYGLDLQQAGFGMEITESELMSDMEQMIVVLKQLKGMGFRLSIDDFGTGYSSLSYLRQLPVDILKVDISFVREIANDPDAKSLASGIVALAHSLHLGVVAEGVETEQQHEILEAIGCDYAQGYLFSRPVPPEDFEQLIKSA